MKEKSEPVLFSVDHEALISNKKTEMFDKSKMGDLQIVQRDLFEVVMIFLTDYLTYIKMLNDVVTTYGDDHKHLWAIYEYIKN